MDYFIEPELPVHTDPIDQARTVFEHAFFRHARPYGENHVLSTKQFLRKNGIELHFGPTVISQEPRRQDQNTFFWPRSDLALSIRAGDPPHQVRIRRTKLDTSAWTISTRSVERNYACLENHGR
jgi:hypothetical protein